MGSNVKMPSIVTASHGYDDVGFDQASGTISAIADGSTIVPRFTGKLCITVDAVTSLKVGMPIRTAALDSGHNGLTRILYIHVASKRVVVNITYNASLVDATGTWKIDGGAGNWDAFMPMGADLTAANLTITFWDTAQEGSQNNLIAYLRDKVYVFPGGIKTIQIATAGNVRLIRGASLRPQGATAQ